MTVNIGRAALLAKYNYYNYIYNYIYIYIYIYMNIILSCEAQKEAYYYIRMNAYRFRVFPKYKPVCLALIASTL